MANQTKNVPQIRIGLLESEPIRRDGFEALFADVPQYLIVATDVRGLIQDTTLRIALVDLHDSARTLDAVKAIRAGRPDVKQMVMGPSTDEEVVLSMLAAGVKAYLDESSTLQQVEQALEVVGQGSIWAPRYILSRLIDRLLPNSHGLHSSADPLLTPREEEVLQRLMRGESNQEIAEHLGITCRTVKSHIARLLKKTGAGNRIALSLIGVAHALQALPLPDSNNS